MSVLRKENGSLIKKAGRVLVDLALSLTSNNAVANKAVTEKLQASDGLIFNFTKSGTSYGYKDANGNFVPFKKVQASKAVTASTSAQTVTPDSGYHGIASVTVNPQVHSRTRASVTSNGTIDLGETHNTRYVPVNVSGVVGNGTIVYRSVHDDHRSGEAVTYTYTATSAGTYLAIGLEYGGENPSTTGTITFSTTGTKVSSGDDYYNANGRAVRIAFGVFTLASGRSVSATCTAPIGQWPCRCLKVFKV